MKASTENASGGVDDELERIRKSYGKRDDDGLDLVNMATPHRWYAQQEKELTNLRHFKRKGVLPLSRRRILEVGCGYGDNLLNFIRWGADPGKIVGNELMENRLEICATRTPPGVTLYGGDASRLELKEPFDLVLASTVFSSILDPALQNQVARAMWRHTKPGGAVIIYDFTYNNPWNPDVRGVPLRRIREMFPAGAVEASRITLAPPVARRVGVVGRWLYHMVNWLRFLRTHVYCWIEKPTSTKRSACTPPVHHR